MWRSFFSIFLILAIMLPGLTRVGIFIDFKMNQEYFASEVCEEKEIPFSNCNGNCYLAKKFKQASESENKQAPSNKNELQEMPYWYAKTSIEFLLMDEGLVGNLKPSSLNVFYSTSYFAEIFRPPKASLV